MSNRAEAYRQKLKAKLEQKASAGSQQSKSPSPEENPGPRKASGKRKRKKKSSAAAAAAGVKQETAGDTGEQVPRVKEISNTIRRPEDDLEAEERLREAALWLLTSDHGVRRQQVILEGRRIQAFKGRHFSRAVQRATNPKFARKFPELACRSSEEAVVLGDRMLQQDFIYPLEKIPQKWKRRKRDPHKVQPHETQQDFSLAQHTLYAWHVQPSPVKNIIWGSLLILGTILICMIKVWPLWLKLAVYWISLTYVVTMLSLLGIRLGVFAVFWIIGFRGVWLLPNLTSDDVGIMQAFSPLISWPSRQRKLRLQRKLDRERIRLKADGVSDAEIETALERLSAEETGRTVGEEEEEDAIVEADWKFGVINVILILVLVIWGCREIGLFDIENIPESLISKHEIFRAFPSLAPPGYVPPELQDLLPEGDDEGKMEEEEEEEQRQQQERMPEESGGMEFETLDAEDDDDPHGEGGIDTIDLDDDNEVEL